MFFVYSTVFAKLKQRSDNAVLETKMNFA